VINVDYDHNEIEVVMYAKDGTRLGAFWLNGERHSIKPGRTLKVTQVKKASCLDNEW
jgi:hypothetical protein